MKRKRPSATTADSPAPAKRQWCPIKTIVDEACDSEGCTIYQVKWEERGVPPSWVYEHDVTDEAIQKWNQSKPRPSKKLKPLRDLKDSLEPESRDTTPSSRPRTATPRLVSPSIFEGLSTGPPTPLSPPRLAVEIPRFPGFDPSEFVWVPASQTTGSQTEKSSQLTDILVSGVPDESLLLIDECVIPDSQEFSLELSTQGSSPQPVSTQTSQQEDQVTESQPSLGSSLQPISFFPQAAPDINPIKDPNISQFSRLVETQDPPLPAGGLGTASTAETSGQFQAAQVVSALFTPPNYSLVGNPETVPPGITQLHSSNMDMPGDDSTGLSAVEQLRRMQQQAYSHSLPDDGPLLSGNEGLADLPTISPADLSSAIPPSSMSTNPANTLLNPSAGALSLPIMEPLQDPVALDISLAGESDAPPQQTVSPAEVNPTMGAEALATSSLDMSAVPHVDPMNDDAADVASSESSDAEDDIEPVMPSHLAPADPSLQEYLVTLPFQASRRDVYINTIRQNADALVGLDAVVAGDATIESNPSLRSKIEQFFNDLLDVCDLPDLADGFVALPDKNKRLHAIQTNCKFAFLNQVLEHLRQFDRTILIVSRKGNVFSILKSMVSSLGLKYIVRGQDENSDGREDPTVILATSDQSATDIPEDVDCIVQFDHTCRQSELIKLVRGTRNSSGRYPLVFTLVVTHALDHIYWLSPVDGGSDLEYKGQLCVSLHNSIPLLVKPEIWPRDPVQLGIDFGELVRNTDVDIDWTPVRIPPQVFETFSSQISGTHHKPSIEPEFPFPLVSRKRQLDDINTDPSKRARLVFRDAPGRCRSQGDTSTRTADSPSVDVVALETKIAELEKSLREKDLALREKDAAQKWDKNELNRLKAQEGNFEKTNQSTKAQLMKYMRGRQEALKAATKAQQKHEKLEATIDAQKQEIKSLTERVSELQSLNEGHANLDVSKFAKIEKALKEAEERAEREAKAAESAKKDMEFFRERYQAESQQAHELARHNRELVEEAEKLRLKASDNIIQVNRINTESTAIMFRELYDGEKVKVLERERVIRTQQEEIKRLNSRRETRQGSVPRSPRLGVMSPRAPIGRGGSSRGTSPAASIYASPGGFGPYGGDPYQGQMIGNGRLRHLRDP